MGAVTPVGIGLDAFWDSLIHCKSGIGPITLFDVKDYPLKIAGEIKDFDLRDYLPDSKPNRLARQTQLGLVACKMALENAGLTKEMLQGSVPLSLVMGICSGAVDITEQVREAVAGSGTISLNCFDDGTAIHGELRVKWLADPKGNGTLQVVVGTADISSGEHVALIAGIPYTLAKEYPELIEDAAQ